MPQRLIRGLAIAAVALGILFGGRSAGLPEPVLVGAIVVLALFTRAFVRGRQAQGLPVLKDPFKQAPLPVVLPLTLQGHFRGLRGGSDGHLFRIESR